MSSNYNIGMLIYFNSLIYEAIILFGVSLIKNKYQKSNKLS